MADEQKRDPGISFRHKALVAWADERGNRNTAVKAGLERYIWLLEQTPLPLPETVVWEALNGVLLDSDLGRSKKFFQAACLGLVEEADLPRVRDLTDIEFLACLDWFDAAGHHTSEARG